MTTPGTLEAPSMIEYMPLSPFAVGWLVAAHSAYYAVSVAAAWRRAGEVPLPPAVQRLGTGVALAGVGLTAAGMSQFGSVKQIASAELGELVDSGVYRVSRNPQYAGYMLALTGAAVARRSAVAAVLSVGAAAGFRWWISLEERYLRDTLGDVYRAYQRRTHRWLGLPQ